MKWKQIRIRQNYNLYLLILTKIQFSLINIFFPFLFFQYFNFHLLSIQSFHHIVPLSALKNDVVLKILNFLN